jgi:FkbM family methyltransferase
LKGYLRLLQRTYFLLYRFGLLRFSHEFNCHYYVRRLIRSGDTVIDIGANLGYYSILFARWVGKTGKVYSVEPVRIYNELFMEKARKYPNIVLQPYALGPEEKKIEMVFTPENGYFNTGLPHVYDEHSDGAIEGQQFRFEADMKRPSLLFADLPHINYIKCDVEGFEYQILSEMQAVILRHKPIIQVEVWEENEEKVKNLLLAAGYTPFKVQNGQLVKQDKGAATIDGDYIFIPDM